MSEMFGSKWPSVMFQGAILAVGIGLLASTAANPFVVLSIVMVFCTVALQLTSRRFLWLYPGWRHSGEPAECSDTHFLRGYLLTATVLLCFGIVWGRAGAESSIQGGGIAQLLTRHGSTFLVLVILIFGVLIPIYFWKWGNEKIRNKIKEEQISHESGTPKVRTPTQNSHSQLKRNLEDEANRISSAFNGAPVAVVVGGGREFGIGATVAGFAGVDRLRDQLGVLQTAMQIESINHLLVPLVRHPNAEAPGEGRKPGPSSDPGPIGVIVAQPPTFHQKPRARFSAFSPLLAPRAIETPQNRF